MQFCAKDVSLRVNRSFAVLKRRFLKYENQIGFVDHAVLNVQLDLLCAIQNVHF